MLSVIHTVKLEAYPVAEPSVNDPGGPADKEDIVVKFAAVVPSWKTANGPACGTSRELPVSRSNRRMRMYTPVAGAVVVNLPARQKRYAPKAVPKFKVPRAVPPADSFVIAITDVKSLQVGVAICSYYSLKMWLLPESHVTVISPPLVATGRPVAVSINAISGLVVVVPVSL